MELKKSKKRVRNNSATLTFDISDYDGWRDLKTALNAQKMSGFILDFEQAIRAKEKYEPNQQTTWGEARDLWNQTLREYGFDPYDL